ncbi:MAG TPA: LCP family protein [Ktedonobacteraceae bacterium]|nr:LCP family protein [Ktedonobacteraceae bacterium]
MDNDKTIKLPPNLRGAHWTSSGPQQGVPSQVPPAIGPMPGGQLPPTIQPPPKKTRKRWPLRVRVILALFLLLLLIGGGTLAYGYYSIHTSIAKFIRPVSRSADEPQNTPPIPSDSNVTGRAWNILLLGSDNDGKYNFPALLTQVMMIVHIDTVNNTVTMVSIPRDSWVNVPEVGGMHKIDQAFILGATQRNNFDDGVRLARLTVEKDYGITIDRYAWVGLSGFARVIDTLGGLDIDVTHPVVDDIYPDDTGANANNPNAYKRLYFAPGPQHLNGLQALEYVRTRHSDLVGDIGRTQRQQQVLQALKQKLNLASVLGNLQQLFADLNGSVYTDLSENEMLGFAGFGHGLSGNAIQHITLGPGSGNQDYGDYASVYDSSIGANQNVVVPRCDNIQPVINRIFGLGNAQSCNVTA